MAFTSGSSTNRPTQKFGNISHNMVNSRQVKRTASGLTIAPSADLVGIASPFSVYDNMQASSAKSNVSQVIPMKPSN